MNGFSSCRRTSTPPCVRELRSRTTDGSASVDFTEVGVPLAMEKSKEGERSYRLPDSLCNGVREVMIMKRQAVSDPTGGTAAGSSVPWLA